MLPRGQVHLIAGPSGSGKTTISFQLIKALQKGKDFLGRRTRKVKLAYISGDRPARSVEETQRRVGVEFPIFSLVDKDMIGASLTNEIIPQLPKLYGYKPDFIYADGFTSMVDEGEINKYLTVAKWLGGLQRYCAAKDITILGACHTTKTKENEKFLNARQRVAGSVAWAGFTETVLIIEPNEKDPDQRLFHILPRNGREEHNLILTFDEDGLLQPPPEIEQEEDLADLAYEGVLVPGEEASYTTLWERAKGKGLKRRTFDRWLQRKVTWGKVLHPGKGLYKVPEIGEETKE